MELLNSRERTGDFKRSQVQINNFNALVQRTPEEWKRDFISLTDEDLKEIGDAKKAPPARAASLLLCQPASDGRSDTRAGACRCAFGVCQAFIRCDVF
jgi:hypothetical protein